MSKDELEALQREVHSLQRTVNALTDVAEDRQTGRTSGTSFQLFDRNLALKSLVDQKTEALRSTLKQLGATQALLLHAQKLEAVGQLAAGVAHEINTPMQYIGDNVGFVRKAFGRILPLVQLLNEVLGEEGPISEADADRLRETMRRTKLSFIEARVPRALEQAAEGVLAVSNIVSAMKEFSHPGTEEMQPTCLNNLVRTTRTVSRNEWKYVADVNLELDDSIPPVLAHGNELNQVILNMIVNATHAIAARGEGDTKGTITLSTSAEGESVVLAISDTGAGIPPDVVGRVFDPFFTTKEVGKGTGQGLAIAHSIVQKHNGTIDVNSVVGSGTTFRMAFPRSEAVAA